MNRLMLVLIPLFLFFGCQRNEPVGPGNERAESIPSEGISGQEEEQVTQAVGRWYSEMSGGYMPDILSMERDRDGSIMVSMKASGWFKKRAGDNGFIMAIVDSKTMKVVEWDIVVE